MMFKKFFALFLVPLIIVSSGGLNIFKHYCHSHHHSYFSIIEPPSCIDDDHSCSHCGMHECSLEVETPHCENSHWFVQTVKQSAPTTSLIYDFSAASHHLLSDSVFDDYNLSLSFCSSLLLPLDDVFWDVGLVRDRGANYLSILFSSLKLDC